MKKVTAVLLLYAILMTMFVFTPFSANANEKDVAVTSSGTTGDCTWVQENGVLTISGNGKMENYVEDFEPNWGGKITTLVIENGVTSIGSYAFYKCRELSNITIADTVTSIGSHSLDNTAWYNNQPDGLVYAGKVAFKMKGNCPSEVVIKDNTVGIAAHAFDSCWSLTSVTISNSVTNIDEWAFYNCRNLTSLTIPDSVTNSGGAFLGCTRLTSVTLPQSAVNNFKSTFDCYRNIKKITLSDNVTSISSSTFSNCTDLSEVIFGDSIECIGSSAFYNCPNLKSVTIPASVTEIYDKSLGYYIKTDFGESKVKGFTIYGYSGSEAQRYANNNNFIFIALDSPTEPEAKPIKGDVDGDGKITVVDTTYIQRYLAELEIPDFGIGDPIH